MKHKAKYTWKFAIPSNFSKSIESKSFTAATNEEYKWFLEVCRNTNETYLLFLCLNSTNEPMPTAGKCEFYVSYFSRQPATKFVTFDKIKFKPTVDNWGDEGDPKPKLLLKSDLKCCDEFTNVKIYCEVSFFILNPITNCSFYAHHSSFPSTLSVSSNLIEPKPNIHEFRLSSDLRRLLENEEFSDIVISVKDKDYKAHKSILIARSPVFASMFRYENMGENQQDKIVIKDLDEQVVEEMLNYIYTGRTDNLQEQAGGLLAAADKYCLDELKDISEKVIIENLSVDNAVNALKLADLHCAYELKSCAIHLIVSRSAEVMKTPAWKTMTSSSPHLSVEVCEALSRLLESKLGSQ